MLPPNFENISFDEKNIQKSIIDGKEYIFKSSDTNCNNSSFGCKAFNAFDENPNKYWFVRGYLNSSFTSNDNIFTMYILNNKIVSVKGHWIEITLPEQESLNKFEIKSINQYRSPRDFLLLGSMDERNFEFINFYSNITNWSNLPNTFLVSNKKLYKTFRLVIIKTNGDVNGNLQIKWKNYFNHSSFKTFPLNNTTLLTTQPPTTLRTTQPTGCILIWSGNHTSLPSGWAFCDGQNSTPDLRGRFVLGLNPSNNRNSALSIRDTPKVGGSETHTLQKNELPAHEHSVEFSCHGEDARPGYQTDTRIVSTSANWGCTNNVKKWTETSGGGGQSHNNMPPFYILAYIMKVD